MSSANSSYKTCIALVDCNNFFASCERVFRPELANVPVAVLSHNDGRVIARSNEVKELGIAMGAPYFQVKELLQKHQGVIVSGNHCLYSDLSARVMSILANYTPELEIYSIDEAFLDLTGMDKSKLISYCQDIVKTIKQWTGIPVSIGIANTKVMAKAANRLVKRGQIKGGVLQLTSDRQNLEQLLSGIAVGDLWGVGAATGEKLRQLGINTASQLQLASRQQIRRLFGVRLEKLVMELNGIACLGLEEIVAQKQIMVSRSFGTKVTAKQPLIEAVTSHMAKAAVKLRAQGSVAKLVIVFIGTSPYNKQQSYFAPSATIQLPAYSADTLKFIKAAVQGLERIFRSGYIYSRAGVMLSDIQAANLRQLQLFSPEDDDKSRQLMTALDQVNSLHGAGTVYSASAGFDKSWHTQRKFLSKTLISSWDSLPKVT